MEEYFSTYYIIVLISMVVFAFTGGLLTGMYCRINKNENRWLEQSEHDKRIIKSQVKVIQTLVKGGDDYEPEDL